MKAKRFQLGTEKRALTIRLRKIQGQIEGVRRMLESPAECSDVLMQVVSIRRALKSFSEKIIESHLYASIEGDVRRSEQRRRFRSLLTVLERYVV